MPFRICVRVEGQLPPSEHGRGLQKELLRVVGEIAPAVAIQFHDKSEKFRPYALAPVRRDPEGGPSAGSFEVGVFDDRSGEAVIHALDACDRLEPRGASLRVTKIKAWHLALEDLLNPGPASVADFCIGLATIRGQSDERITETSLSAEWAFEVLEPVVIRAPDGADSTPAPTLAPALLLERAANRLGRYAPRVDVPPVSQSLGWVRSVDLPPRARNAPGEHGALGAFRVRTTNDADDHQSLATLALAMLLLGAGDRTTIGRGVVTGIPVTWTNPAAGVPAR